MWLTASKGYWPTRKLILWYQKYVFYQADATYSTLFFKKNNSENVIDISGNIVSRGI